MNAQVADVMNIAKVSEQDARLTISFIDCWLELDWSEASNRKVTSVVREARNMMANAQYAEMLEIAKNS